MRNVAIKLILVFLCFTVCNFNLNAESVYDLEIKKDIVLSTLTAGVFIFGGYIMNYELTIPENLNIRDVNSLDRSFLFLYTSSFFNPTFFLRPLLFAAPFITPLIMTNWDIQDGITGIARNNFTTWLTYGIMYGQATGLAYGTRQILGKAITRYRPYHYLDESLDYPVNARSFPSGGTTIVFLPATFFSVTFSAEFPYSRWKIPVIVGSYTLAGTLAVFRMVGGDHFFTDVLAGAAIGAFSGWLIPTLHRRNKNDNNVSFYITGNGALMSFRF